jgi:hypothetical protein
MKLTKTQLREIIRGELRESFSLSWFKSKSDKSKYTLKSGQEIVVKVLEKWSTIDYTSITVVATLDGKQIGYAHFNSDETNVKKKISATDTTVESKFRRLGVSSAMYDFVKSLGYTIVPSRDQTPDGSKFSKKYHR